MNARAFKAYRLMPDDVLAGAVSHLERMLSQPGMQDAPAAVRAGYLEALDAARAEVERRRA